MRTIFNAAVAAIVAIALYFALVWGYDGLRILTSPSYGLEDVWRICFRNWPPFQFRADWVD